MATFPSMLDIDLGPLEIAAIRRRVEELTGEFRKEEQQDVLSAGRARSAYEGLAGAPLPEVDPLAGGTQQLFGDVASVISRRPEFGQRTREDIKQRGAMLLQQRMQNIQLLRDRYQEEAAKIGKLDPVKALEFSEKTERMNKLLELLHERDMAEYREGQATLRQEQGDKAAGERTQAEIAGRENVARINAQVAGMRATVTGSVKPATAADRQEQITKLLDLYKDKGKLPTDRNTRYAIAQSVIGVPLYEGQTEREWALDAARAVMSMGFKRRIKGVDVPDATGVMMLKLTRARFFGEELPEGPPDLNAPAVEKPGTPPDAALELIDEAKELMPELQAKGPLSEPRRRQAQRRLNQIQAILRARYNLNLLQQGGIEEEGITVRP